MKITTGELAQFHKDGFLLQHGIFSDEEIAILRSEAEAEFATASPRRTLEESSGVVRGVHGSQLYSAIYARLACLPRLLKPARAILRGDVYIHQYKINAKRAFVGEQWQWHQDFLFWHKEDGMPATRAVTCAVFLDDVHEFNGPLVFTPGGHRAATVTADASSEGWEKTLTAELKYSVAPDIIKSWVETYGMVAPKGRKGSVLWFDSNIPHASAPNISPSDRLIVLIAYNHVDNALLPVARPRPHWLTNRDFTPLQVTESDQLLPAMPR